MASPRHDVAFVVGALVGSVAGAVYGLLNAPQPGWRTRADLSGYAEELGDRLAGRISSAVATLGTPWAAAEEPQQWPVTLIANDSGLGDHPAEIEVVEETVSVTENEGVNAP